MKVADRPIGGVEISPADSADPKSQDGAGGTISISAAIFESSQEDAWRGTLSVGDGWTYDRDGDYPPCTAVAWASLCGVRLWARSDDVRPVLERARAETRGWEYADRDPQCAGPVLAAIEDLLVAIVSAALPSIRVDHLLALGRQARLAGRRTGRRALAADFRRLIGAAPSGDDPGDGHFGEDDDLDGLSAEARRRLAAGMEDARAGRLRRCGLDELDDRTDPTDPAGSLNE